MVTIKNLRSFALSLPETTEEPHFEKTSFRVKKKIFATYDDVHKRACVKLSEIQQNVFSAFDKTIIYPLNNKWGKQGWTIIEMKKVNKELLEDAIKTAYCEVAPQKLAEQIRNATMTIKQKDGMKNNDKTKMKSIVEHYYKGKFQTIINNVAKDVVWTSHKMTNVQLKGKQDVIDFLENVPPGRFTFENTNYILDDKHVVVEGICRYTNKDGKKIENFYCDIFTFKANKIIKVSAYFI